jgi:Ca-activated chloride channel homolog
MTYLIAQDRSPLWRHRAPPSAWRTTVTALAVTVAVGAIGAGLVGCSAASPADVSGGNVGFGGAQDIGQFRDIVNRGEIPGIQALDANGFFAEHYVEQPPASCGRSICVTPMVARGIDWLSGGPQTVLQLALTTTIDPSTLPRRPLSLVLVVDRSGSMASDSRLLRVQSGLNLLLGQLRAEDRVALVSFDDQIKVEAGFGASRDTLHAAVDRLSPRGGTDIYDGLAAGLQLARAEASPQRDTRVLLLSDGLATAGITDTAQIVQMAERSIREGIGLSTVGVGREFDPSLMRTLAERGAGTFYFAENPAAVNEIFSQELKVVMTPLALDLTLEVTVSAGALLDAAVGAHGWTASGSRGSLAVPAVFATSRSGAPSQGRRGGGGVVFVRLRASELAAGAELAAVTLSYRLPGATERERQVISVSTPPRPAGGEDQVSHPAMQKQIAMYNLFVGLSQATQLANDRQGNCAMTILGQVSRAASLWNQTVADADLASDIALVDHFAATLTSLGYQPSPLTSASCVDVAQPPILIDEDDQRGMACSSSGGRGGLLPLALALALGLRRRRANTARAR